MKINLFNRLRKYETWMYTAVKADYIRGLTATQMNDLIDIASELGIKHVNNHCPKCNLDFVRKIGVLFFEQKEKMEKKHGSEKQEETRDADQD